MQMVTLQAFICIVLNGYRLIWYIICISSSEENIN